MPRVYSRDRPQPSGDATRDEPPSIAPDRRLPDPDDVMSRSLAGVPILPGEPLGRPPRGDSRRPANLAACWRCLDAEGRPRLWRAWSWPACPSCGEPVRDVRCGARHRPELCRKAVDTRVGGRCGWHKRAAKYGSDNPAWRGGVAASKRFPFELPLALTGDVERAWSAEDRGLRPHAAVLDALLGQRLREVADATEGRSAALAHAREVLAGDSSPGELRAALDDVVAAGGGSDAATAEERLLRVVDQRRRLALADARIEATAHDLPPAVVDFFAAWSFAVGRAVEAAKLEGADEARLRRGMAEELRAIGSAGGVAVAPLADAFLVGSGSNGRGAGDVLDVEVEG